MSALRNYLNKIKPNFQKGGKLHAFESVFDGFESFLAAIPVPPEAAAYCTYVHLSHVPCMSSSSSLVLF